MDSYCIWTLFSLITLMPSYSHQCDQININKNQDTVQCYKRGCINWNISIILYIKKIKKIQLLKHANLYNSLFFKIQPGLLCKLNHLLQRCLTLLLESPNSAHFECVPFQISVSLLMRWWHESGGLIMKKCKMWMAGEGHRNRVENHWLVGSKKSCLFTWNIQVNRFTESNLPTQWADSWVITSFTPTAM